MTHPLLFFIFSNSFHFALDKPLTYMSWQKLSVFLPPAMLKYLCASWFVRAPSLFSKAQQQTKPDNPFAPQVKFIGRGPAGVSPTHHWVWTQGPFWGPKGPGMRYTSEPPLSPKGIFSYLDTISKRCMQGRTVARWTNSYFTYVLLICFCCLYLWILEVQ